MKIAHVINYFQPQIGYQETFLVKEQLRQGQDVNVITSDRYYPFFEYDKTYKHLLGRRICGSGFSTTDGIPTHRLRTMGEVKFRVWLVGLEKLISEIDPDFVHVHGVLANAFRLMKMKKAGMKFKLIIDEHIVELDRKKTHAAQVYNHFKINKIKKFLDRVDRYVGVYRESCEILRDVYRIPDRKIAYIPLGADHRLFCYNEADRQRVRKQFNLSQNDVVLLYTGKININKGVETLVRAFNLLNQANNVFFLFLGSVEHRYKEKLIQLLKAGIRQKVFFHDFVPNYELPKYYSAADLCLWGEGITISMLEAMSCSRPIVVCDIPPAKERIANGNGLCYDFGNASDLAEKLAHLIENPNKRHQMGQRGRDLIENKFSWKKISEQFLSL